MFTISLDLVACDISEWILTLRVPQHLSASACPYTTAAVVVHINMAAPCVLSVGLIHGHRRELEGRDLLPTPWIVVVSFIQRN